MSRIDRVTAAFWLLCAVLAGLVLAPQAARAQASPSEAGMAAASADQYRIGPGDSLRISVYQSPDLSLETRVTEAGVVSFPLLGAIRLGGLTVGEAETAIASALKKGDFIKNPQVTIVVTLVRANQVNVLGQVNRPGRVPLDVAGMRLTDVLALSGGITPTGSDVVVVSGTRDGKPYLVNVDLPTVFSPQGRNADVVLRPGDAVWVDRVPTVYLYGEVQRPGQFRLERGMSVLQALAGAGGLTQRGTQKGLRVQRKGPDGRTQTIEPALDDVLRDGDVVFVRESLF